MTRRRVHLGLLVVASVTFAAAAVVCSWIGALAQAEAMNGIVTTVTAEGDGDSVFTLQVYGWHLSGLSSPLFAASLVALLVLLALLAHRRDAAERAIREPV